MLAKDDFSLADRWILSRLQSTIALAHEHMASYRFDLMSQVIYDFIWNEYCDWYVELSKPVLWDAEAQPEKAQTTRLTLLTVLEQSLRLTHPLMPYITEEIWQKVAPLLDNSLLDKTDKTIMLQAYPQAQTRLIDPIAEADIDWVKGVIEGIRNIRGEMDIAPGRTFPVYLRKDADKDTSEDQRRLQENQAYLLKLAKLSSISWLSDSQEAPVCATQLYKDMEILVPLADLIDKQAEISRLEKEISRLDKGLQAIVNKLSNARFVDNAPAEIVATERERQVAAESALSALQEKLEKIQALK